MTAPTVLVLYGLDDTNRACVEHLGAQPSENLYSFIGNVDVGPLLERDAVNVVPLVCGAVPTAPRRIPRVDVVFSAICDPDTNGKAVEEAARIVRELGVPVINRPEHLARTTRDSVAAALADEPGVVVPTTLRLAPTSVAEVVERFECGDITAPVLVREAGAHGGDRLALVEDVADLPRQLEQFAIDGRDYYLTEFIDYRSPDGLYRKHRAFVVDGRAFAKHMVISTQWRVHAGDRAEMMTQHPGYEDEEKAFLRAFDADPPPALASLHRHLGLDYFGVDFGVDAEGRLILFEANSCVRALRATERDSRIPHHRDTIARLRAAVTELIRSRARTGRR